MKKLPVIEILIGAFVVPWLKRKQIFRKCIVITLVTIGLVTGIDIWDQSEINRGELISTFIWIIWFIVIAVTCHRVILLDDAELKDFQVFRFSKREWRFLGWTMVLSLLGMVILTLFANLKSLFYIDVNNVFFYKYIWMLPAYYFMSRFSLVLPACALDHSISLRQAWRLTTGNGWRIFVIVVILPIILSLVSDFIFPQTITITNFLNSIFYPLITIIEISALSLSYRFLSDVKSL